MEDIKVGEYVRTISGNIDKVDALYGMIENTIHLEKHKWQDKKNIVKHSPNIIDLIEVGDYVNGEKVTNTDNYDGIYTIEWEYGNVYTTEIINDKFIKSIVTKEQFNAIEYKMEEN